MRFSDGHAVEIGVMFVDLCDSGNPDDEGLTVGLRGWRLNGGSRRCEGHGGVRSVTRDTPGMAATGPGVAS